MSETDQDEQPDPDFTKIFKNFVSLVASGGTSLTTEMIQSLIEQALHKIDDFFKVFFGRLDRVDKKIQKMLDAEYKVGIACLNKARETKNEATRVSKITEAAKNFSKAAELVDGPLVPVVHLYAAYCNDLLQDPEVALKCYKDAFKAAWNYEKTQWDELPKVMYRQREIGKILVYHNNLLIPLARLILIRSAQLKRMDDEDIIFQSRLVDLLQYPWDVRLPPPQLSEAEKPWEAEMEKYLSTATKP